MPISKKIKLNRRNFLLGGFASIVGASQILSSCSKDTDDIDYHTIKAAYSYKCESYNPIGNINILAVSAGLHVFESLYEISGTDGATYSSLAVSEPQKISDLVYEVKIRDNSLFSDGRKLTAKDVVYSFKKNIENANYSTFFKFLREVSELDSTTVRFELRYKYSLFISRLSIVRIIPYGSTNEELEVLPIGSGPWAYKKIDAKSDGGSIEFVPNPVYTGKFPPQDSSMTWNIVIDDHTRCEQLDKMKVLCIDSVPLERVESLRNAGATVTYFSSYSMCLMLFNTFKKPFNDKRVRRALFYAIDYDRIISNLFYNQAYVPRCLVPNSNPYYHRAKFVYNFDLDKAKKLLAEAGYQNLSIKIKSLKNWTNDILPYLCEDFGSLGIKCDYELDTFTWDDVDNKKVDFDIIVCPGSTSVYGQDPDAALSLWYGDTVYTQARTLWKESDYNAWAQLQKYINEAQITSGVVQQMNWNRCYDLISEELPMYPLLRRDVAFGYYPQYVVSYEPDSTGALNFVGSYMQD